MSVNKGQERKESGTTPAQITEINKNKNLKTNVFN